MTSSLTTSASSDLARRAVLAYERRQERETLGVIRIWGGGENQEDFGAILKREHLRVE